MFSAGVQLHHLVFYRRQLVMADVEGQCGGGSDVGKPLSLRLDDTNLPRVKVQLLVVLRGGWVKRAEGELITSKKQFEVALICAWFATAA